jgi:hypothetical protein
MITKCDNAKENCRYFPTHAKKCHLNFSDPSKLEEIEIEIEEEFQKTRDVINSYCETFVNDNFYRVKKYDLVKAYSLFLAEIDFIIVSPYLICFLSFTLASEFA